jgi:hypothetical protein
VDQKLPTLSVHRHLSPVFSRVSLAQSFVFYVMFCISLSFCLFVVVLSCLSDYPFVIFNLFSGTNI